jgi:hypothetical protein
MRASLLALSCMSLMLEPATGQVTNPGAMPGPGGFQANKLNLPVTSEGGIEQLERSALLGDRRASALLAVLLQENARVADGLVKSAIHFQVAIAAGCTDLDGLAARTVERLSPEQRVSYEEALPRWVPTPPVDMPPAVKGRCLGW